MVKGHKVNVVIRWKRWENLMAAANELMAVTVEELEDVSTADQSKKSQTVKLFLPSSPPMYRS